MTAETGLTMEQKIMHAAERLFLEKGFAMTSTGEIAKEAGCNQTLVHYYFRTKDRLFETIFQTKISVFITDFLQIGEANISFEEKLRRKIEAHFDMLDSNRQLPFLFLNELITNPARIASVKENFGALPAKAYRQFRKELAVEIGKGSIRDIAPLDIVLSVFALNIVVFLMHPVLKEVIGMDEPAFRELADRRKKENVAMVLASLRP